MLREARRGRETERVLWFVQGSKKEEVGAGAGKQSEPELVPKDDTCDEGKQEDKQEDKGSEKEEDKGKDENGRSPQDLNEQVGAEIGAGWCRNPCRLVHECADSVQVGSGIGAG